MTQVFIQRGPLGALALAAHKMKALVSLYRDANLCRCTMLAGGTRASLQTSRCGLDVT